MLAHDAAFQLLDHTGYAATALYGISAVPPPEPVESWTSSGLVVGVLSVLLALLLAAAGLYPDRLPRLFR
jgi:hypothetical protein